MINIFFSYIINFLHIIIWLTSVFASRQLVQHNWVALWALKLESDITKFEMQKKANQA